MSIDDKLMKPRDLANFLGLPVATLYRWRYRGDGPPGIRLGKHLRYRRGDVESWLDTRRNASRTS